MKRARLILGAGFLGTHLIQRSLEAGRDVRVLDHKPPIPAFQKARWHAGSLSDARAIERLASGAHTLYFLLMDTVPADGALDEAALRVRVDTTLERIGAAIEGGIRRIVFASSSAVYGPQQKTPIPEQAPTRPTNAYGKEKILLEQGLTQIAAEAHVSLKIMRLANPYGPGQKLAGKQGFIALAIGHLAAGTPLSIFGDGATVRDFVYVDDVVDALERLDETTSPETVFNVGSGRGATLNEVVDRIEKISGRKLKTERKPARGIDVATNVLDLGRARSQLGFEPRIDLDTGLRRTLTHHGLAR